MLWRYSIRNGYMPLVIADGMLSQLCPDIALVQELHPTCWDNQDLMVQVFKLKREFLQRPIWMLKEVESDPCILV